MGRVGGSIDQPPPTQANKRQQQPPPPPPPPPLHAPVAPTLGLPTQPGKPPERRGAVRHQLPPLVQVAARLVVGLQIRAGQGGGGRRLLGLLLLLLFLLFFVGGARVSMYV